ncbi:unnamed protein product [Brassica oleracea]
MRIESMSDYQLGFVFHLGDWVTQYTVYVNLFRKAETTFYYGVR